MMPGWVRVAWLVAASLNEGHPRALPSVAAAESRLR